MLLYFLLIQNLYDNISIFLVFLLIFASLFFQRFSRERGALGGASDGGGVVEYERRQLSMLLQDRVMR